MADTTYKVLLIDDSPLVRAALSRELRQRPGIAIIGAAEDPVEGGKLVEQLKPDAIVLDLEMPRMDGLTFLRDLQKRRPTPTIIVSSLTARSRNVALACLEAGAIDVFGKPGPGYTISQLIDDLERVIRNQPRMRAVTPITNSSGGGRLPEPVHTPTATTLMAIGASTGGPEALRRIFERLPGRLAPIVMTQHMPPGFTAGLAERLSSISGVVVREANDGEPLVPGVALIAPGNRHMRVRKGLGGKLIATLSDGPTVSGHRPSVDVLFQSIAEIQGLRALGMLLTGMGEDGAEGLGKLRAARCTTVAQDAASCVVHGMPRVAAERGHVQEVLPLDRMAECLVDFSAGKSVTRRAA